MTDFTGSIDLSATAYGPVGTGEITKLKLRVTPNLITKITGNLKTKIAGDIIFKI